MGIFSGKKALIIGGSGGIGKALCRELLQTGASLTIHGGHDSQEFSFFIDELKLKCNTQDDQSVTKLVVSLEAESFSQIFINKLNFDVKQADILCVCFGPFLQKSITNTDVHDWQDLALLDYALPGVCLSSALPNMITKKWGRILLFGGTKTYSINGYRTNAAYAGAKTGVCSLVKSVALEYAENGITCNALLPGFVDTEYVPLEVKKILSEKAPDGKLISVESMAKKGLFLLESSDLNGVLLNVDSGWHSGAV